MKHSTVLSVLCAALFLVLIGWAPESVFAQRGGHGGGGGFHGGGGRGFHGGGAHGGGWHGGGGWQGGGGSNWHGGSGSWHSGGYYGGGHYHGGGYYGGHGGWGYPGYDYGYGYGWGFSIGFNWGPFWGGFGYPYGYAPGYYPYSYPYAYPYPYPYYVPAAPAGYAYPSSSSGNGYAYVSGPGSDNYVPDGSSTQQWAPPEQQSNAPAPRTLPATNPVTIRNASYTSPVPGYAPHAVVATSSNYRPASSASRQLPPLRPEVQNVIRALRAMPPAARQRQLESGRYSNLTPRELEIVRYAADLPQS